MAYVNPVDMIQPFLVPLTANVNQGIGTGLNILNLQNQTARTKAIADAELAKRPYYEAHADLARQQIALSKAQEAERLAHSAGNERQQAAIAKLFSPKTVTVVDPATAESIDSQNAATPATGFQVNPELAPQTTRTVIPTPSNAEILRTAFAANPTTENLDKLVDFAKIKDTATTQAYKPGHIQAFDAGDGRTVYKEYGGIDASGNAIWKDRPELGGKTEKGPPKGYDTMEEAVMEAQRILSLTPKDAGLVATAELGAGNKWVPKLAPNITVRIPPFTSAGANMFPGYVLNRKTGNYEWRGEGPAPGMTPQASLDWQAMKKSAQTINGPTFKRLIDNAEVLAKGVYNPQTKKTSKPELDQVADLRDQLDDGFFGKINNQIQKFNSWDQFINYQISDPKMARFVSKVMANVDTLASVYSGGGTVTSDFKMKFAKDLFASGLSKEAFRAKMDTHKESVIDRAIKYAEPNVAGLNNPQPSPLPIGTPKGASPAKSWADLKKAKGW